MMKAYRVLGCALALTLALVGCGDDDDDTPTADAGRDTGGDRPDTGGECEMGPENTEARCSDGCDNDGNGFTDCDDFACERTAACGAAMCEDASQNGPENTAERCSDGCDNDGNGFVDCRDFSCRPFCGVEASNVACANGVDDDNNGFIDCRDRQCFDDRMDPPLGLNVCLREMNNAACSDGMDNDGDGMIDCDDPDCQGDGIVVCDGTTPVSIEPADWAAAIAARCSDGEDNSENGFIDCGDNSCVFFHAPCREAGYERGNVACSDGMDNDLDGLVDCDDPGCDPRRNESIVVCVVEGDAVVPNAALDGIEAVRAAADERCSDEESNDSNEFVDCADFTCLRDATVSVCDDNANSANERTCMTETQCTERRPCQNNPDPSICAEHVEKTEAACSDGRDNDGNNFFDCADFACRNRVVCNGRYAR